MAASARTPSGPTLTGSAASTASTIAGSRSTSWSSGISCLTGRRRDSGEERGCSSMMLPTSSTSPALPRFSEPCQSSCPPKANGAAKDRRRSLKPAPRALKVIRPADDASRLLKPLDRGGLSACTAHSHRRGRNATTKHFCRGLTSWLGSAPQSAMKAACDPRALSATGEDTSAFRRLTRKQTGRNPPTSAIRFSNLNRLADWISTGRITAGAVANENAGPVRLEEAAQALVDALYSRNTPPSLGYTQRPGTSPSPYLPPCRRGVATALSPAASPPGAAVIASSRILH